MNKETFGWFYLDNPTFQLQVNLQILGWPSKSNPMHYLHKLKLWSYLNLEILPKGWDLEILYYWKLVNQLISRIQ